MMQTVIGAKTALGVPGEHGNTQPYRADSYIADAAITMGTPVILNPNGKGVIPATAATALGLAVSPHEHVRMVLPTDQTSLEVPIGATVAVASKGCWFVAIPTTDGTYAIADGVKTVTLTANTWVKGAKLAVASGKLAVSQSGTFAEILAVDEITTVETATSESAGTVKVVGQPVALIRLY